MKSFSPWATVPLPSGSPCPSGRTSMSQPRISSAVGARPMLYFGQLFASGFSPARSGVPIRQAKAAAANNLGNFNILDLTIGQYVPGLDTVVVIDRIDAADLAEFDLGRLHISGLVLHA